ncbi:MAG: hypothetical protein JKY13_02340 [Gammaproteobacteria bacterium]|nr:hypothetical protein [Gammaproteobacteria bacterium]
MNNDLTRWNWSDLHHIDYIDGNAAVYLDRLREKFAEHFPQWEDVQWVDNDEENKTARLLGQYQDKRRDWGWELSRSFARAGHVLTEYINAYANEGFIDTATQWESLRRLAALVNYHPTSPASAITALVIEAKEAGLLSAGFQVKNEPSVGKDTVIFETLSNLALDPALNNLYAKNHLHSNALLSGHRVELVGEVKDLVVGQPLVLAYQHVDETSALESFLIENVKFLANGNTQVQLNADVSGTMKLGSLVVHAQAEEQLALVALAGQVIDLTTENYLPMRNTVDLYVNQVIYISSGDNALYGTVASVTDYGLTLTGNIGIANFDVAVGNIIATKTLSNLGSVVANELIILGDFSYLQGKKILINGMLDEVDKATYQYNATITTTDNDGSITTATDAMHITTHLKFANTTSGTVTSLTVPDENSPIWFSDTQVDLQSPIAIDMPEKIVSDDFVVLVQGNISSSAHIIEGELVVDLDSETARLSSVWRRSSQQFHTANTHVYGHFKQQLRVVDWQVNHDPLNEADPTKSDYPLTLQHTLPESLLVGQAVFIESLLDEKQSVMSRVSLINGSDITLSDPLPRNSTPSNLVFHANVVTAGHGERKNETVLGSGNATQARQNLTFPLEHTAFVADENFVRGMRADIIVTTEGKIWQEVESLVEQSQPTDHHYMVNVTEEGYLKLTFGDGRYGRRLPGGIDNVRIQYRQGSGTVGNVNAQQLTTIVKSNALVDAVRQPVAASGGSDMQTLGEVRQGISTSTSSLGRAVSLPDFETLTVNNASVWQAKAVLTPTQGVNVVILPAGGSELSDELSANLLAFLQNHTTPGTVVNVSSYTPLYLNLSITVFIDETETTPASVTQMIRQQLLAAFSTATRLLGQGIYRGELYGIVEGIAGVRTSECHIDDFAGGSASPLEVKRDEYGIIHQVLARDVQLIYLSADLSESGENSDSTLNISVEPFK